MDTETSAQQFDHEDQNHHQQQQQHLAANNTDSSFTPLTDKVDDVFLSFRLILVLSVFQDAKEQEIIIYEFHFPADLCGRLIGRQGVHVDYIRQMTQVDLVVRDDAVSYEKQVVALHGQKRSSLVRKRKSFSLSVSFTGRRRDIEQAIELIAKRFPPARYPQVAFKPINKKIVLRQCPPERVPIPQAVAQVMPPINRSKEREKRTPHLASIT